MPAPQYEKRTWARERCGSTRTKPVPRNGPTRWTRSWLPPTNGTQSAIRDEAADEREQVASLRSFLSDPEYDASLTARRAAATDRSDSKSDRSAGASDRANLSDRPAKAPDQGRNG